MLQAGTQETAPFLLVDGNLGVPKNVLYALYPVALSVFASARANFNRGLDTSSISDLKASTAAILLANPAHQTALNMRKRLIHKGALEPVHELGLTASLLSSRNCSNQAILWYHRQWLLQRCYGHTKTESSARDPVEMASMDVPTIPLDVIRTELSVASNASEIYPRNYFSWMHRRFCVQSVLSHSNLRPHSLPIQLFIAEEISAVRLWIERHISDASAVHYLITLIVSLNHTHLKDIMGQIPIGPHDAEFDSLGSSAINHALGLVKSYPNHECLWMYLRAALRLGEFSDDGCDGYVQRILRDIVDPLLEQNGREKDIPVASWNASRFRAFYLGGR